MFCQRYRVRFVLAFAACLMATRTASAAQARFHYAPTDGCGALSLKPAECLGTPGERLSFFGLVRDPVCAPPRPTHFLSFQHPSTGRLVTVPVCLPEGSPSIEYRTRRVIYNYGSYTVEVQFLADGSVDVVYNSGFLRGL